MKSIKQQYIDLTEGRMSQGNFMRNLRMTMPQYVTNVTSFGDAVKILKNKGIIAESYDNQVGQSFDLNVKSERGDGSVQNYELKNVKLVNANGRVFEKPDGTTVTLAPSDKYTSTKVDTTDESLDNFDEAVVITKKEYEPEAEENDSDAEFDALLKQIEDQMAGEEEVKAQWDIAEDHSGNPNDKYVVKKSDNGWCVWEGDVKVDEFDTEEEAKAFADKKNTAQGLNENKGGVAEDENLEEITKGITIEHECYPDLSYESIEKMVKKNVKKNANYYTNFKLTGIRDYALETMDKSKPEDHQMKFYTEKTAVDTARGMKKVKIEKKKLKEQVEEAEMRFKDLPADPEKYKMVKDSKGKIIKATNADGVEFQRGDVAKAYDGEEIKISDFKEEQGKVKAIYNTGMFFKTIDIDGLEPGKPTFRPGVNMGGSFEKFKNKIAEMVREIMAETFDGRDNLDAETEK